MSVTVAEAKTGAKTVRLGEVAEINPKLNRASLDDDFDVSFVPMAAVGAASGEMDATTIRKFKEVKKGYTYFRDGDVLFAKVTPCMENGKMAIAKHLRNGIGFGSTEFHVLRPLEDVDASYLYHFVSSETFRKEAARHMTGAVGLRRVPTAFLEGSEIPLPEIGEQKQIVAEIEKQFSRLNEAVANLKRVKANLKRYKAAVLKAAVEGRLVPTEAELARKEGRDYETGEQLLERILEARRKEWNGKGKYKEPSPPEASRSQSCPEGWTEATIEQVALVVSGLTKNPSRDSLQMKLPYLRVANVYANELRIDDIVEIGVANSELEKLLVEKDDLLIVEGNGSPDQIGRVALWDGSIRPCVHQNHLIKVRASIALPGFILNWLLSPNGRNQIERVTSSTSGLHTLSAGKVARLTLPLAPISEQRRIVEEVDRRLSLIRNAELQTDVNLKRAERMRQAILSAMFRSIPKNGL